MCRKSLIPGLFLLALLTLCRTPSAAEIEAKFRQYSPEDGLSQSSVYCIIQDDKGFLWFGTQDGLNRYDGYQFKVYKNIVADTTSISDNRIRRFLLDRDGNLWVGTRFGLNRYERATDAFARYHAGPQPYGLSESDIRGLFQDSRGAIWIGTNNRGLNRLDPATGKITWFNHNSDDRMTLREGSMRALAEDHLGDVWVGHLGGGLTRIDPDSGIVERLHHDPENPNSLSANFVMALATDADGFLWIGTYGGGLDRYHPASGEFVNFRSGEEEVSGLSSNRILSLFTTEEREVWLGTLGGGVNKIAYRGKGSDGNGRESFGVVHLPATKSSRGGLPDDIARAVYIDRSGNLWVGTNTAGVAKLDLKPKKFGLVRPKDHFPEQEEDHVTTLIKDERENVWVGTNSALLQFPAEGKPRRYRFAHNPGARFPGYIFALAQGSDGSLLVGAYGNGFFRFWPQSGRLRHFKHDPDKPNSLSNNRVTSLLMDHLGRIWIGTADGLNRFDPVQEKFTVYRPGAPETAGISDNSILTLYQDRRRQLWVGTSGGGVSVFEPESATVTTYSHDPADPRSLSNDQVLCVHEDDRSRMWIGTANGLNRLDDAAGIFTQFFESDGLPNSYIAGILSDSTGTLWIATNKGLSRMQLEADLPDRIRNYSLDDGLHGLDFSSGASFQAEDGEMFFGGSKGFNHFYPERIVDNDFEPPIVITAFQKVGRDVVPGTLEGGLELNHRENYISAEFAALDFSYPERNQYAYMLQGLDEDWIYSGTRRFASYSNIEPGEYTLRVKGSNSDGVWNESGTAIDIVIHPPFWATWWFRLLTLLAVGGVLALVYNYRVGKLLEVERTRNRIAQDLHDEVGATLSSISYFAEAIRTDARARGVTHPEKFLSLISESSSEAQEAMSDIIWTIDPGNDRWDRLLAKFRRFASDLLDSKGIGYEVDIPRSLDVATLDMERRRNFWLIYKEMLTNIARHSNSKVARISIWVANNHLHLKVEDEGVGFDRTKPSGRNGIRNIFSRAQSLQGDISLETGEGRGTSWTLRFRV